MTSDKEQEATNEYTLRFAKYVGELAAKVTDPLADGQMQFLKELEETLPKDKRRFVTNPISFYQISSALYPEKSPTMGELSQTLSVPLSTATRMVDWWVERGLAERLSDQDDRRIVRVELTDSGRRIHEVVELQISRSIQEVLNCLTSTEQNIVITLLDKVVSNLHKKGK